MSPESPHERWKRWNTCRLCHQTIRGNVKCALGWACWKTYANGYRNGQCDLNVMQALTGVGLGLRDAGKNT